MSARRLPPLPRISDIIQLYNLSAKSQLSQNFLLDLNVTDKLVKVAGNLSDCCVCEVGPGPGSLTRSILSAKARKVVAIEKDARFLPSLELLRDASGDRLDVHHADVLDFDLAANCSAYVQKKEWHEEPPNLHIIGNLPFNISIPLLLQWLSMIPKRQGPFRLGRCQLTLTFQKEVAERIIADVSNSQRSRPSVMAQHLCDVKWGFLIGSKCFVPKPKVEAVVLKLTPLVKPLVDVEYKVFERVVRSLFQFRRKFIKRGAMLLFPDHTHEEQQVLSMQLLAQSGVDYQKRAQDLSVEEFGAVCHTYCKSFMKTTPPSETTPLHGAAAEATPQQETTPSSL